MAGGAEVGASYSTPVAFIFLFNLVIGVGALNLPYGAFQAGLVITVSLLVIMAFLSYMTITFIIETLSITNALIVHESESAPLLGEGGINSNRSIDEKQQIESPPIPFPDVRFDIDKRVEMGQMAELFLGKIGKYLFYIAIIIYLFGDLAIYAVTVPSSLRKVTGAWSSGSFVLTDQTVYYLYLFFFMIVVGPFCFLNFQKTRYLQYFTMLTRNVALMTMIGIALSYIAQGKEYQPVDTIPIANWSNFPAFFGVSIYAYMCHHSLPSIIAPIENKKSIYQIIFADIICIFLVYTILCVSGLFAFGKSINSLYTFNFADFSIQPIAIFLELFPVFTLSSNYPLIAITLRNNIITLIKTILGVDKSATSTLFKKGNERKAEIVFSAVAILPAFAIAYATSDVKLLVKITGAFAGLVIMFVSPALLIFFARRKQKAMFGNVVNPYQSPFKHTFWIILVLVWSVIALGLAIYNIIMDSVSSSPPTGH